MIVNGRFLTVRSRPPIVGMATEKLKAHGTSYGLVEAGYDIRIKQDIIFFPNRGWRFWKAPSISVKSPPMYWRASFEQGALHKTCSGRFVLASAIEEFDMPPDLVGVVHDKSSWARKGVSVFNTVIEPGFKGGLTLEIVFHGNEPIHIPAGAGIAQILFHKVQEHAQYNGKYQNQSSDPVPAIFEK